eukprot:TRINITY_DN18158_c0_g1_i1.p1 TRINITY_DN18158_c0_g1~~TRINITY_DN18158_c0_g1_i1.p1  ORF type:complete len:643 (+),score=19.56 TRINITY_DN18158_c0_g1_i1:86-2014(+)
MASGWHLPVWGGASAAARPEGNQTSTGTDAEDKDGIWGALSAGERAGIFLGLVGGIALCLALCLVVRYLRIQHAGRRSAGATLLPMTSRSNSGPDLLKPTAADPSRPKVEDATARHIRQRARALSSMRRDSKGRHCSSTIGATVEKRWSIMPADSSHDHVQRTSRARKPAMSIDTSSIVPSSPDDDDNDAACSGGAGSGMSLYFQRSQSDVSVEGYTAPDHGASEAYASPGTQASCATVPVKEKPRPHAPPTVVRSQGSGDASAMARWKFPTEVFRDDDDAEHSEAGSATRRVNDDESDDLLGHLPRELSCSATTEVSDERVSLVPPARPLVRNLSLGPPPALLTQRSATVLVAPPRARQRFSSIASEALPAALPWDKDSAAPTPPVPAKSTPPDSPFVASARQGTRLVLPRRTSLSSLPLNASRRRGSPPGRVTPSALHRQRSLTNVKGVPPRRMSLFSPSVAGGAGLPRSVSMVLTPSVSAAPMERSASSSGASCAATAHDASTHDAPARSTSPAATARQTDVHPLQPMGRDQPVERSTTAAGVHQPSTAFEPQPLPSLGSSGQLQRPVAAPVPQPARAATPPLDLLPTPAAQPKLQRATNPVHRAGGVSGAGMMGLRRADSMGPSMAQSMTAGAHTTAL